MRKANSKRIGYKKERVVLSDVLPYEVPPYFSNRYFYNFLISNKVCLVGKELRFKKDNSCTIEKIIRIIFGLSKDKKKYIETKYDFYKINNKDIQTIPFFFRIAHKNNDFRELAVIHPINQLQLIGFYDKYKHTIKDATNISNFSLRKPHKIASLKYFKDKTHLEKHSSNEELEFIESSDKEYTSLKTFYTYHKCSNIFKFYESYEYQRAEKKFDNLLKFDISRCFDSIYTHSVTWALLNKKIVKDQIKCKTTFGHKFDELMQKMNYNETNGIVIGPEFSRIFAEIILQRVDKTVEKSLYEKNIGNRFAYKEKYDIFRYVDDFFVFYNDDAVRDEILKLYKINLQEYNLFFNESKTETISKPIITNITIAKEEIRKMVEHSMIFSLDKDSARNQMGIKYYYAKDIITNYKLILSNTNTSYKDLQNYFLVIIFNKLKKMISKLMKEQKELLKLYLSIKEHPKQELLNEIQEQEKIVKTYYNNLFNNFNEIIELTFFIYTVLPRVTYSIKLCHILQRIIDFIKNQEKTKQKLLTNTPLNQENVQLIAFDFDKKHTIFKKIYDGIQLVFTKSKSIEYSEVETLYLLPIVNELGVHYSLPEKILEEHFKINTEKCDINYFTIISLMNYIQSKTKYSTLKANLQSIILKKMINFEPRKAEDIFLLIDILVCPYIADSKEETEKFRLKILDSIHFYDEGISKNEAISILKNINSYCSNWFYDWKQNDFGIELNTKRGHNVY